MVKGLEAQKRRGWTALIAGALIVVLMGAVWVWVDRLFAGNGSAMADPSAMQFLGRLNVAFALVVISGVLGIVNGWLMTRTGRRSSVLVWALAIVFISALFTAFLAVNSYHGG